MAKTRRKSENEPLLQDIFGIAAIALGAVLLVGICLPHSGMIPETLGLVLKILAGSGSYIVPILLGFLGYTLLAGLSKPLTAYRLIGGFLLFLVLVSWCQFARTHSVIDLVALEKLQQDDLTSGGGYLGLGLWYALEWLFGIVCSHIILVALAVVSLLLITGVPFVSITGSLFGKLRAGFSVRPKSRVYSDKRKPERLSDPEMNTKERPELLSLLKRKIVVNGGKQSPNEPAIASIKINGSKPIPVSSATPPVMREDSEFKLPPITLLKEPTPPPKRAQAELNYKIDKIEQTLEEFKIDADVVEVSHGPTVTRYEIQLAPGIKVSKIVNLADNLAMALAAIDVRVEAPIPGKSAIGVEVPNDSPAVVTLREVIDTDEFRNAPSKLMFALGKDVAGEPKYADLTKMPHMLVAGATNAGKSVCLNSMIMSLLYRATPREVKFVLIDPKRVELSLYEGIPHLCTPVVKDVRQAAGILRSMLKEMERRYDLFVRASTRNFDGYNQKVKSEERLPYIVIIVDELADLMMQAGPEVEFSICRLAQLARATGIHLVIATQRPSVDVVTGTIKANISSRLSFAVNSQVDSRTILDMGGAERLIGRGDMLFKPIDASKPTRVQGCYLTDKEIEAVTRFLKEQESPDYTMEPVQVGESGSGGGGIEDASTDEHYEPAVRLVVTSGYASTSMIQRRFKIGYTRAARLVDTMEEQGIVGPLDGAKPREVLIAKGDLDRLFGNSMFESSVPDIAEEEDY